MKNFRIVNYHSQLKLSNVLEIIKELYCLYRGNQVIVEIKMHQFYQLYQIFAPLDPLKIKCSPIINY